LTLTILDGMKRAIQIVGQRNFSYQINHREIEISLDEKEIPPLLNAIMEQQIIYTNIRIEEPTLEDYFLKIAEKQK
jgi:ABC-type multidrug transport system ATPase subunit